MRTQVAIVGGGPSGLLLGRLLARRGVDTVVLERRPREHVLGRVRAGVLERGLVALLREAGVAARLDAEGIAHHGAILTRDGERLRIDFAAQGCGPVTVYGQTEVTRDLYAARDADGAPTVHGAEDVAIHDPQGEPSVTWREGGAERRLSCDFVAGCDGFHGISRRAIPEGVRREYEKTYPFGWMGILARTPPVADELVYASSERGFALCSMRSHDVSRHYVQCPSSDAPEDWPDDRFWEELRRRLPPDLADGLVAGPSFEKSVAPLRSFVCEPMRWGRLFLCGDAAHIVPPTGAKGLNTAASDVRYLFDALRAHYEDGDDSGLDAYSERALARVWKVERFSWWMTRLLHRFPGEEPFDARMQAAEFAHLRDDPAAQASLAAAYVGLPY